MTSPPTTSVSPKQNCNLGLPFLLAPAGLMGMHAQAAVDDMPRHAGCQKYPFKKGVRPTEIPAQETSTRHQDIHPNLLTSCTIETKP